MIMKENYTHLHRHIYSDFILINGLFECFNLNQINDKNVWEMMEQFKYLEQCFNDHYLE